MRVSLNVYVHLSNAMSDAAGASCSVHVLCVANERQQHAQWTAISLASAFFF